MNIIDNFIYQHFDNIYAQVISGPDPIKRKYLDTKDFGNNLCKWDLAGYLKDQFSIEEIKRNLYDSIRHFFYICLNSSSNKIYINKQNQYAGIGEKIKKQLYLACLQHENLMTSDIYENYMEFTDQVIKYMFLYLNIGTEGELSSCELRIKKFGLFLQEKGKIKDVYKLIKAMQATRNRKAHYAYKYSTNRKDWLDQITYLLYDYITIFYYTKYIIKTDFDKKGYERIKKISIKFSIKSNSLKDKDFKICLIPKNAPKNSIKDKACYKEILPDDRFQYKLELFKIYILYWNGKWSEPFEINNKFTDGCNVIVDIPPFPKLDEPQLLISDICNINLLPPEAIFILDSINDIKSKSPYGKEIDIDLVKEIFLAIFTAKGNNQKNLIDSLQKLIVHNNKIVVSQMDINSLFKAIDDKIRDSRTDNVILSEALEKIDALYRNLSSSNNLGELEKQKCEKAIDNITLAALLDSENTIKNESNTYDSNVHSTISKVDKALLKILDSDKSEDIHEEISKVLKTSEDCLYVANISNQIFTHTLNLSKYSFFDDSNSAVAVDNNAVIKTRKVMHALDLKTRMLGMILNQNELNQVKFCVHFGNIIISNLISTLSLLKSSELIIDYVSYEKDINNFSIFIKNLMKQRDNPLFKINSFNEEEWTSELYEYLSIFKEYLAKADNNSLLYHNLLWIVRWIDNALILDTNEKLYLLYIFYEGTRDVYTHIYNVIFFKQYGVDNEDFLLLSNYRNFIEMLKGIKTAYNKALLIEHNKGIDEKKLVVDRLIEIINGKYKKIGVPKYVKDIEEAEFNSVPHDLKIRMLATCGEPFPYDVNMENLNDYALLVKLFENINDSDSNLLNNEFIKTYIKEYLPCLSNPQFLDIFFEAMKDAKEYCRKIIKIILKLAQDETTLELAYRCNFVDEHTPKEYGLSIIEFIGNGYYKILKNTITPDEDGMINLVLSHSRRLARLVNWTKDLSDYESLEQGLRSNIMGRSTLYSLEYFPENAYNDLLGLKPTDKTDFKLRILEYICNNKLIHKKFYEYVTV